MIILCWVQLVLLVVGLFSTAVSDSRSSLYNKLMPHIIWWSLILSMLVMPLVLIVLASLNQIIDGALHPYYFFVIMIELGNFVWSLRVFKPIIDIVYSRN